MKKSTAKAAPKGHDHVTCTENVRAVMDALYVLNGKWKLPLLIALQDGPRRFSELQKLLADITPRVLSKELKEMELNQFVERKVIPTVPVTVTYELTPHSVSLEKVLNALRDWGMEHRRRIMASRRRMLVQN